MENNSKSEIVEYIENNMFKLFEAVNHDDTLIEEIESNKDYITQLLLDKYARERGIQRIKKLKLSDMSDAIIDELRNADHRKITKELIHQFFWQQQEPIKNSLYIFFKTGNLYRGALTPVLSFELSDALQKLNWKGDIDIERDFTNELRKKLTSLEKEVESAKDIYEHAAYAEYLQDFKNVLFALIQRNSLDARFNHEALRRFATNIGLVSNELLVSMPGIPASQLHNLIDVDALLDKLEAGTITRKEQRHIFPVDYTERYLYYLKNSEPEKAEQMLKNLNPQDVVELFRKNQLDVDNMITILQEMINSGIRSSKVKEAVKKLIYFDKKEDKRISELTAIQVLKLVKANLLSDEYLMDAYYTQEGMIEENPSIKLYPQNYSLISIDDLKEQFTPDRLLRHYSKQTTMGKAAYFYHNYVFPELSEEERDNFEKQLISNEQLTPSDIIIFFKNYNLFGRETFLELKESKPEIQQAYYEYIKKAELREIFSDVENGYITEEELIDIFDDKYYDMVREGISHACISLTCIDQITFLDSDIVIDEYHKSIKGKEEFNPEDESFDFRDILIIYLGSDSLINISHIIQFVEENEDPMFHTEDFNLSVALYERIVGLDKSYQDVGASLDMTAKIRELYLNGLLSFDELAKLTEEGIISSEESKKINKEFCDNEMISKLKAAKLGGSVDNEPKATQTPSTKSYKREKTFSEYLEKMPNKKSLVSQQTDVMLEILKQYGYAPITTETNAFGFSEIQTFSSGNFEDYMVLLSEEIPEVAILMHSKHVDNTDIYYQTGGNATYILSTAKLKQYLEQLGAITSKFSHLKMSKHSLKTDDPYLRTANVTKNWGRNIPRKIHEVLHMLEQPSLEEHSSSIVKSKTNSFKPETILPENLSDKEREARLETIELFNSELENLKKQIENDANHGI